MARSARAAALLLAVLCAVSGLQSGVAAAAAAAGTSAAAGTRVPCRELPELQRHAKRVSILGKCRSEIVQGGHRGLRDACISPCSGLVVVPACS